MSIIRIWAHFLRLRRKKPGFPFQVLGFAYANPVGFPLQSLARAAAHPEIAVRQFRGRIIAEAIMRVQL
jgi:hypothetical protein